MTRRATPGTLLYLRARNAPAFVLGLAATALTAWWAADWLVGLPGAGGPQARRPVAALAPALAAAVMSATLGAADEELERATARPWRRIRLGHALTAATTCAGALAVTGLWAPDLYGAHELLRNTAAAAGMTAVAAVVVGARLCWAPAFGYAVVVSTVAPAAGPQDWWWAWPTLPSNVVESWWSATGWCVLGLALFAVRGCRVRTDREPT